MPGEYWNHNTAYHPWLLREASTVRTGSGPGGAALDAGSGDGLLLERLRAAGWQVTGIDPDPAAVARSRARLAKGEIPGGGARRGNVIEGGFLEHDFGAQRFALITFVASLHHMDLATALTKARDLTAPGGMIAVIGLARDHGLADLLRAAALWPVVRVTSAWHHEVRNPGVVLARPAETLPLIRRTAGRILPGVRVRRALHYRYLLTWRAPG